MFFHATNFAEQLQKRRVSISVSVIFCHFTELILHITEIEMLTEDIFSC